MSRLREPDVIVLKPVEDDEQRFLMETSPDVFFLTDHYRGYPTILVRLSKVSRGQLEELVEECWRRLAGPKLLAQLGEGKGLRSKSATSNPSPKKRPSSKSGVSWQDIREMALSYPGMALYPPGDRDATQVRLGKKHLVFMSREPGAACLRPLDEVEQRMLMETQPETYFLTDHYRSWSCILIRLEYARPEELAALLEQCWRRIAPKTVVKAFDAEREMGSLPSRPKRVANK
jgi:hypothetical protein